MPNWKYCEVTLEHTGHTKRRGGVTALFSVVLRIWEDTNEGGPRIVEASPRNILLDQGEKWAYTIMARLGKAGWELVAVERDAGEYVLHKQHFFFKKSSESRSADGKERESG